MGRVDAVVARYRVTENPLKALRRLELVAVALAALFLAWAVLGGLATAIGGGPKPLFPAEDTLKVRALGLEPALDEEGSDRLVSRPLFWEGRRAIDKQPLALIDTTPKPVQVKKLEGVSLHGVYGEGESLGVIATVDGELTRINANSSIKGWKMVSYADGEVTLKNGGRTQSLPLELTAPSVRVAAAPRPEPSSAESEETQLKENTEGEDDPAQRAAQLRERVGGLGFGGSSAPRGKKD